MLLLCCVWFSFSIPSEEVGLGNISEMTYFVSRGMQNSVLTNKLTEETAPAVLKIYSIRLSTPEREVQ